jgi:heme-degrading monooxygenase HmoA
MYAIRTEVMVVAGKVRAFEAWWVQLGALAKAQRGFQEGTLLNSFSYPAKYVFLMRWESREARQAWAKSEAFSAFFQANPPQALATPGRAQEAYDVLVRVTGEGQPAYAGLVEWTLDPRPDNAASFERSRQEIFELRKQHVPGFVLNGLGRLSGHQHRYQVVQFYSTMDALRAASPGSPIPQLQAFGRAHPPSEYANTPLNAEVYEVAQHV